MNGQMWILFIVLFIVFSISINAADMPSVWECVIVSAPVICACLSLCLAVCIVECFIAPVFVHVCVHIYPTCVPVVLPDCPSVHD